MANILSVRSGNIQGPLNVPWSVTDALFVVAVAVCFQGAVIFIATHLGSYWPAAAHFVALDHGGDLFTKLIFYFFYFTPGFGAMSWVLRNYHVGWEVVGWRRSDFAQTVLYLVAGFVAFKFASTLALDGLRLISGLNGAQVHPDFFTRIAPTH